MVKKSIKTKSSTNKRWNLAIGGNPEQLIFREHPSSILRGPTVNSRCVELEFPPPLAVANNAWFGPHLLAFLIWSIPFGRPTPLSEIPSSEQTTVDSSRYYAHFHIYILYWALVIIKNSGVDGALKGYQSVFHPWTLLHHHHHDYHF